MARSKSGRIVLEIDPILKKNLYLALGENEQTLKDWFVVVAREFVLNQGKAIILWEGDSSLSA